MYRLKRLRQIRELALYLFGGVPETPKPIYETDTQGFSEERNSHGPTSGGRPFKPTGIGEPAAIARYDEDKRSLVITRLPDSKLTSSN